MKKPIVKIWNALISLSLIYFSIFLLFIVFGVFGIMDNVIPNKDVQQTIREIFGYGFMLFWIYLVLIPLRLTGIIRFEKSSFMTMIVLAAITIVLFVMTEVN